MEEHLLSNPDFSQAIISAFTNSKADSFENFLEPLQKLLRLSPPIASSLANPELFSRASSKLRTKKALVRLNILRIIRSIVEAADEDGGLIEAVGLAEIIIETAKTDPAILVREMASDLLKSSEVNASRAAHSGRTVGLVNVVEAGRIRPIRRSSSSTMTPGGASGSSLPPTPVTERPNISRAGSFFDPSIDLARSSAAAAVAQARGHLSPSSTSSPFRPVSRDCIPIGSPGPANLNWAALNSPAANGFVSNLSSLAPSLSNIGTKSRLPRTSVSSGRPGGGRLSFAVPSTSSAERPPSRARPATAVGHGRDGPRSNGARSAAINMSLVVPANTSSERVRAGNTADSTTPTSQHWNRPSSRLGQPRGAGTTTATAAAAGGEGAASSSGGSVGSGGSGARGSAGAGANGVNVRRSRRLTSGEMR